MPSKQSIRVRLPADARPFSSSVACFLKKLANGVTVFKKNFFNHVTYIVRPEQWLVKIAFLIIIVQQAPNASTIYYVLVSFKFI